MSDIRKPPTHALDQIFKDIREVETLLAGIHDSADVIASYFDDLEEANTAWQSLGEAALIAANKLRKS